jgi:hypothetical protein
VSKEEREFLDHLREKSIAAAAEIMESLQRLKLLYEEITDDGSGNPLPRPRPGDFFYRLARFELEHASNVIRLGNSQAELIFDHVRQLARRSKGGGGGAVSTSVVELKPDSRHGEDVFLGTFDIKNTSSLEADTRFECERLLNATGVAGGADLKVACGNGRVPPYQTARVDVWISREKDIRETMFGAVTVFLSTDVERQVARRAVKIRAVERAPTAAALGAEHK